MQTSTVLAGLVGFFVGRATAPPAPAAPAWAPPEWTPPAEPEWEPYRGEAAAWTGAYRPFDPWANPPRRVADGAPLYPRHTQAGYGGNAWHYYWLDEADGLVGFPQTTGADQERLGPGWVLVLDAPGDRWRVGQPAAELAVAQL